MTQEGRQGASGRGKSGPGRTALVRQWLLGLLLCGLPAVGCAGNLLLCSPGIDVPGGRLLVSQRAPDGQVAALWAVEELDVVPEGCPDALKSLPVVEGIQARFLAPDQPAGLAQGFALLRKPGPLLEPFGEIVPREDVPAARQPQALEPSAQLGMDLLPFGVEDRVRVEGRGDGIRIQCNGGRLPAGAVLKVGSLKVPAGQRVRMRLSYDADAEFEVLVSDVSRSLTGDPLPWLQIERGSQEVMAELPLGGLQDGNLQDITFSCPAAGARLNLKDLRLEPVARHRTPPARALWIWESQRWRESGARVLAEARKAGADTVFVSVPVDLATASVEDPGALASFVSTARAEDIAVHAVTGDPQAVLATERQWFAVRARAYGRYNAAVEAQARLAGLQLDIEPWIDPSYGVDPLSWNQAYLQTVREVRAASTLALDLAVPFWWNAVRIPAGQGLLEALAPLVDSVTVMNYRTREPLILASAQPFLDWSLRHGRQVRIALEAGPIDDAVLWHLRPAGSGEIALLQLGGYAVMLSLPGRGSVPGAAMFRSSHTTPFNGDRTSFRGREAEMMEMVESLERRWSAWPGFAGVALHEYQPR